jgi:hypothetical protein
MLLLTEAGSPRRADSIADCRLNHSLPMSPATGTIIRHIATGTSHNTNRRDIFI